MRSTNCVTRSTGCMPRWMTSRCAACARRARRTWRSSWRDEFLAAGAGHIAERLNTTIEAVRCDDRGAAAALLRAMTATRFFDRMLTLEVAASMLAAAGAAGESDTDDGEEDS